MKNFDKRKALRKANRLVKQGKYQEAITELKKIVEADPEQQNVWVKIAELYVKLGDNGEAIKAYVVAAIKHEAHKDYVKSINILRTVLKLSSEPTMVSIFLKLAGLYQKIGLPAEAIAEYRIAIGMHEKNGYYDSCVPLLEEVIKLDPDKLANRVKLAEAYFKIGRRFESEAEIEKVAKKLRDERRPSDLIALYERYFKLSPGYLQKVAVEYNNLKSKVGIKKEKATGTNPADEIRRLDKLIQEAKSEKSPTEPFSTPGVSPEDLKSLEEASAKIDEVNKAIKNFLEKAKK